jgi:hypothetical protein
MTEREEGTNGSESRLKGGGPLEGLAAELAADLEGLAAEQAARPNFFLKQNDYGLSWVLHGG